MKEELKKNTPKKSAVKKNAKKTTTKSAPKKTNVKTVTKKSTKSDKVVIEKVKAKKIEVPKEEKYNKKLLLNVFLVIGYVLIIALLVLGFVESMTNNVKVEPTLKESYIVEKNVLPKNNIITLDESKEVLGNLDGDYFVYIGYKKKDSDKVRNFEIELSKLIDKYDLKNKFYYINIDSLLNNSNAVNIVNEKLGYTDVLISKLPTILYVNSENIIRIENIITRNDNNLLDVGDFQNLLDINQFKAKK